MARTSQRRASAPTPQMGLFQQPAGPPKNPGVGFPFHSRGFSRPVGGHIRESNLARRCGPRLSRVRCGMPWGFPLGRRSRTGCLATNRAASRKGYPTPLTLGQLMSIIPGSLHHLLCGRGCLEHGDPTASACVVIFSTTSGRAGSVPHRRHLDPGSKLGLENQGDSRAPRLTACDRPPFSRATVFTHGAASFR